ncbi:hypothetical protein D770_21700 [Flammeovirgaceae bacterium 311]|nr:hypothetical protein D770_21700 [Flammeovirgaceae bacterium 311]
MNKVYFSLLLCLMVISNAMAQTYNTLPDKYSTDNYVGSWDDAASWRYEKRSTANSSIIDRTDSYGVVPDANAVPSAPTGVRDHINIQGYITRYGDLTFANNYNEYNFSVNDTLVVTGTMTLGTSSMDLRIPSGGVLIVFGVFDAKNKIVIENGGILVVKGDMKFNSSDHEVYTSPGGELFVNGNVTGNTTASEKNEGMDSLRIKYPAIYRFINQTPAPGTGIITPLPVELLYFKASSQHQGINLEWASAKEWNFSHYTVERSEDGKNFTPIHTEYISGDSYSTKTYSFLDVQPNYGANYYRLKATDIDGTAAYKGMALAYAGTKGELQIYPNPSKGGMLTLKNSGAIDGTWMSVTGASGREMMRIQMPEQELRLPTSVLPAGVYIVKVWNHLEVKQARLVIQ